MKSFTPKRRRAFLATAFSAQLFANSAQAKVEEVVVCRTHFDCGCTDLTRNVLQTYPWSN